MCMYQSNINTTLEKSLNKSIFELRQKIYTWKDILGFATFLGTLRQHWDTLSDGIAVCKFAETENYAIEPNELQTAANNLRYKFNLITAEETEEWLRTRELSLIHLNDFLTRGILTTYFSDQLAEIRKRDEVDRQTILENLWPELILNKGYAHLVKSLIWRLIVEEYKLGKDVLVDAELATIKKEFCQRKNIALEDINTHKKSVWLLQESFDTFLNLEARYQKFYNQQIPEDMANLALKSLHRHLVRICYESVSFKEFEHAKEAFLCITEDGCSLDYIAAKADGNYTKSVQFLEEIPENLRRRLLSAAVEEAIPPRFATDGESFCIYRVLKKIEPQLSDPIVYSRVQKEYIKDSLAPISQANIKWLLWELDLSHG